jgi:hypothetical protein
MLHITNWDELYESAPSRRYGRLTHVFLPNSFDGSKYAELITGENGPQRYAAWVTLLAVASRNGAYGQRGYLQRSNGAPHTSATLALITRMPQAVYEDAIPALIGLGWLEEATAEAA